MVAYPRARSVLRSWIGIGLGCGLLALAHGGPPAAHEPNIDTGPAGHAAATPAMEAIEQLELANKLADFGERQADPVALVEAAKLLKRASATMPAKGKAEGMRTWESLLIRASQLAGSNPTVANLAADVRAYKVRDIPRLDGASMTNKTVKADGADRVEVTFHAGQMAMVYVRPTPPVDLDLYVYDEFENLICSGPNGGHESQCRWRPRRDGQFLLDVRNKNNTEVAYVLAINSETMDQ